MYNALSASARLAQTQPLRVWQSATTESITKLQRFQISAGHPRLLVPCGSPPRRLPPRLAPSAEDRAADEDDRGPVGEAFTSKANSMVSQCRTSHPAVLAASLLQEAEYR
jgi:hypothetical protein